MQSSPDPAMVFWAFFQKISISLTKYQLIFAEDGLQKRVREYGLYAKNKAVKASKDRVKFYIEKITTRE